MEKIDTSVGEAYHRFVRGLMLKMPPRVLREYVTGFAEERPRRARKAA